MSQEKKKLLLHTKCIIYDKASGEDTQFYISTEVHSSSAPFTVFMLF